MLRGATGQAIIRAMSRHEAEEQRRVIVVTGASRGLGRALAEGFARAGHRVMGCARSAEAVEELNNQLGEGHRFDVVDVADADAVERWATGLVRDVGAPGLLVNNAGIANRLARTWEVPADEFSRVIDTNVKGAHHVVRAFVPRMIEVGRGVVVNFSSGWGRSVSPQVGPYCASKWAIEGFSRALAAELPTPLASVALNPGIIDTDMLRIAFGAQAASFPEPEQWAERAVPFLLALGPEHNGESLTVD